MDLSNKRFGRWLVLELDIEKSNYKKYWKCVCDCGREHIANASNLRTGQVKSCG